MTTGWKTETNTEYHSSEPLSSSNIRQLLSSPSDYRNRKNIQTDRMRFGTACHAAILEPKRLKTAYEVLPTADIRTKSGRKVWIDFINVLDDMGLIVAKIDNPEKAKKQELIGAIDPELILITDDESETIDYMQNVLFSNPDVVELLKGVTEQSGYLELGGEFDGIWVKTRPDVRNAEKGYVLDYKTTSKPVEKWINDEFWYKYKYHVQAAWYMDLCNAIDEGVAEYTEFIFLVQSITEPYDFRVYTFDVGDRVYQAGHDLGIKALRTYKECLLVGKWPIKHKIELPKWYRGIT